MTIDELYKIFVDELKTIYDEREANNIADWVFNSIANIKRLDRVTDKQTVINNSTNQQLHDALQQLLQHKPVQYVLGESWFYKMKFKVNGNVLIPRPETEELVEWVVEEIRNNKLKIRNKEVEELTIHNSIHNSQFTILDIGTGSGCIAIAIKKELPVADVSAIDVSNDALCVAKENSQTHNLKINFLQLDFLNEESWPLLPSFDIIVSNPPYIPENEKTMLAKNVVEHEPHLALFITDNDPFVFYVKIAAFAVKHLKENGNIFVEVHQDYAKEVQQIFADKIFTTEIKKDIYDRERMIKACRNIIL